MRAVIFANGNIGQRKSLPGLLKPDDLLIAADGGARHLQTLGLTPDAVLGDFDSLGDGELNALEAAGIKIYRYPLRKDFTDLELALQFAQSAGADEALLLGALGNRWDQTLANLLLPASAAYSNLRIRLVDGNQEISLIQAGQTAELTGKPGDTVSLIPLAGDAGGVTTQGLEYPLNRETLVFGSTRGVSNTLLDDRSIVSLESGNLMCVLIHEGPVR
jgi:thiamine pyrophosphokinase